MLPHLDPTRLLDAIRYVSSLLNPIAVPKGADGKPLDLNNSVFKTGKVPMLTAAQIAQQVEAATATAGELAGFIGNHRTLRLVRFNGTLELQIGDRQPADDLVLYSGEDYQPADPADALAAHPPLLVGATIAYLLFCDLRRLDIQSALTQARYRDFAVTLAAAEIQHHLPMFWAKLLQFPPAPASMIRLDLDLEKGGWYATYECADLPVNKRNPVIRLVSYVADYEREVDYLEKLYTKLNSEAAYD